MLTSNGLPNLPFRNDPTTAANSFLRNEKSHERRGIHFLYFKLHANQPQSIISCQGTKSLILWAHLRELADRGLGKALVPLPLTQSPNSHLIMEDGYELLLSPQKQSPQKFVDVYGLIVLPLKIRANVTMNSDTINIDGGIRTDPQQ